MKKLAIIGASGHGKVIADLAEVLGYSVFFYDDAWPSLTANSRWSVIGDTQVFLQNRQYYIGAVIGIGNNAIRQKITHTLEKQGVRLLSLIHPSAVVSQYASIGDGTVVFAGVAVNADAVVGCGVILNTNCSIDHDCVLGDFAHVSPGANLAGGVTVEKLAWVGIGACVHQQTTIGGAAMVGAGAVVLKDVPAGATVVGNPAKELLRQ